MRRAFAIAAVLPALLLPAADAGAKPGEKWFTARTQAVRNLPARYQNIATVVCSPDTSSASAVRGRVRHWQRFWCTGKTDQGVAFRLRFETRGPCAACWTITHLSGTTAANLRTKPAASPEPSTTTPSPGTTGPSPDYPGLGSGHWLSDNSGDVVRLEDGSLWLLSPASRAAAARWSPMARITVRTGGDASYGYRLVNTDDQGTADARFLRFD